MKSRTLKRTESLAGALLLTLLFACKPANRSSAETKDAAPAAPVVTVQPATAAGMVRYDGQMLGNKCKMEGTSTIHDWTMETAIITGYMEVDSKFPESALTDSAAAKPTLIVSMPVRSFKSGNATMDKKMQMCMSETNYHKIEYRLIELKPKSKPGATGPLQFDAVGALTITGNTVTNTMPVTIEKKDGKIKVIGNTPLKMSDYKVPPPRINLPLLPDITVGDDLKIHFEWSLAPKTKT